MRTKNTFNSTFHRKKKESPSHVEGDFDGDPHFARPRYEPIEYPPLDEPPEDYLEGLLNDPSFDDLSSDSVAKELSTQEKSELSSIGLEEFTHRRDQQLTIASSAVSFAALLFMAAATFGAAAIYCFAATGHPTDWHVYFLPISFLIPPTIIILALIRSMYREEPSKTAVATESFPALTLVKEIASACVEVVKGIKGGGKGD